MAKRDPRGFREPADTEHEPERENTVLDEGILGFAERLRQVIGSESVRSFARRAGLSDAVVRSYARRGTYPSLDRLWRLANAAGVSPEWLATGRGGRSPHPSAGDFTYVQLQNVEGAAGGGAVVDYEALEDFLVFKTWWIHRVLRTSPESLVGIRVRGESMEPTLYEGDVVLVDRAADRHVADGIYVLRMDGELLIKRLQRLPGEMFQAMSDNPAYSPFQFRESSLGSDIHILGRVVWMGHRL